MVILKKPTTELFDTDNLESKRSEAEPPPPAGVVLHLRLLSISIITVLINSRIKNNSLSLVIKINHGNWCSYNDGVKGNGGGKGFDTPIRLHRCYSRQEKPCFCQKI
ncbi:hypothetical protein TSUD_301770 [Trifolium subterraneum]|uniref:Uncharacterized protein n=1 Tax=Trifolium subterraneum TaxID=3900 RepID=A0A2Z6PG56_TRISU|nr:hypothetical protein TSUD_301770 [Trifolium subterraneum]